MVHRETSADVAIYLSISGLIERSIIDITQLECPPLADINLPAIRCTFACHMSKYICALRTAYSVFIIHFTFLICSIKSSRLSMYFINAFQMVAWGLLRIAYYLNEQQSATLSGIIRYSAIFVYILCHLFTYQRLKLR